ncbi:MAG: flagellar biosynthetic protein FliR [Anaerolineae bacterium]|nr:flagellar biosynthetic protein FliR [Anaerolineae bacterium]
MLISVAQFQLFFLALTRVLAIMVQMPFIGGALVPNKFKLALGVTLTMIIVPWQSLSSDQAITPLLPFVFAILREMIIGLLAGFAVNLTFGAFQMAGKLMEVGSGFSAGQIFNPTLGEMSSSYDQLFMMILFIYFFSVDGHHAFIVGLTKTFEVLPVGASVAGLSPDRLLRIFAQLISSAFQMALPIMGAILLADLTLGLLAKVAPQIQVFFLGLPVKVWMGIFALGLSFTVLIPVAGRIIKAMGPRMIEILGI